MNEIAPRVVRFFADWGNPTSLWESAQGGAVSPEDYLLSDALTLQLRLWTEHWERNFHEETGWRSPESERLSEALRLHIADQLRAELGEGFTLLVS